MKFGFVGGSYTSEAPNADAQRTVNWYPALIESGAGKNRIVLNPTPGLRLFCTVNGPIRGACTLNQRAFFVGQNTFYEVTSIGTATAWGTMRSDGKPVSIAMSAQQILVASAGKGYVFALATNTFTEVALPAAFSHVIYADGYFLGLVADAQQFYVSSLLDGSTWDALDTAKISIFPDNVVRILVDHREIWVFGKKVTIPYYDSGNPDFPWEPVSGGFIEQGCGAPLSAVRMDNGIFWIGEDERGGRIAWRAQGYTPVRVSHHGVEYAWSKFARVDDAVAYTYQEQGHSFWVINFPSAKATWVYDAATQLWHERTYLTDGREEQHRALCHVYAFNKHLVGDWENGNIYELAADAYDDAGTPIRRIRRAPHLSDENRWIYHRAFELAAEMGLGLPTGADPQIMLRWSDDGGHTWSNEHWTSAGKAGEYTARAIWRRLGRSRDRVYEVAVSDPIPWRLVDAYLTTDK